MKNKNELSVVKVGEYDCMYLENAERIAVALARAGRFVNIITVNGSYVVFVYERSRK